MKKLIWVGIAVSLLTPALASAQTGFNGTWKINFDKSQMPKKPDVYLIQDGMYHCKSCVPVIEVKADGQDQKVTGDPYIDSLSVKVVDERNIVEVAKKNGKTVATTKDILSADGNTLTFEYTDSTATSGASVTGKSEMMRVEKGPAGSHAMSGSWQIKKVDSASDNGIMFTYKVEADSLSMTTPLGQSFTAKMDGTEAPFTGDPGTTSLTIKRINATTIEETDKRDGKIISVSRATLSADGKSMSIAVDDRRRGTTAQYVAEKQ